MTEGGNMMFFDAAETRSPKEREAAQEQALLRQLVHAKEKSLFYAEGLRHIDPDDLSGLHDLRLLPVTRKSELIESQATTPPFGGLATVEAGDAQRLFTSPGPIYEFDMARQDYWRSARALFAAGFRAGEIVHNAFSYHLTPGGWILDDGARALGCTVIPAGTGNTEQQVAAIAHYRPQGFTGTPDYLKVLLDKAEELGHSAGSITKALVSGGALFPSLRQAYRDRGVSVLQCYVTADLGLVAYESNAIEGMIIDEGVLLEIVRPGTGDPVPDGEVGEVVVTSLNPDYPLIRFATGDLSAIMPGISPCGRTNRRIKGWMGRADQTTKVKVMFVHPGQIADVLKRHPEITKARLVVTRDGESDSMTLRCEAAAGGDPLVGALIESLKDCCKLRGDVELVEPGSLPNDGKVIDDRRDYES
jgi:phenylacetate-CoA ligase